MSKEVSDDEINKINEESTKVYKTPSSPAVPGLNKKKYKCRSCGENIEAVDDKIPEHCGNAMEIDY